MTHIAATPQYTLDFKLDKLTLQREQKGGASGMLTTIAYHAILAIAILLVGMLVWALRRFDRMSSGDPEPTQPAAGARVAAGSAS